MYRTVRYGYYEYEYDTRTENSCIQNTYVFDSDDDDDDEWMMKMIQGIE